MTFAVMQNGKKVKRMSDLIDRQAAIAYAISGRIRTLPTSEDGENWIRVEEVRESLLNMPSAQPTQTNTSNTLNALDTIYRQAAIDALGEGREMLSRVLDDTDVVGNEREKFEWGLGLIESYINDMIELPSAQQKPLKYTGDSICLYCQTINCDGCMYEPMEGVQLCK